MRPPMKLRAKMKKLQQMQNIFITKQCQQLQRLNKKFKKERKTHIKIEEKCDEMNLYLNSQIATLEDHLKVSQMHLKNKDDQIADLEIAP